MLKRLLDFFAASLGLLVTLPLLATICFLVWIQDFHSPFYIPWRVGRNGRKYRMVKMRSMLIRADKTGVDSTAKSDPRITPVGKFIRKCKIDELTQLWNVLIGDMSLVGPRPNVERETNLYTSEEKHLLDIRPGITDLSSIVFADEGDILEGKADPDLAYNQLIRPYKSRLGLLYVKNSTVWIDLRIITLTLLTLISRQRALSGVARIVRGLGASEDVCRVALREHSLVPTPPPGATSIVQSRD